MVNMVAILMVLSLGCSMLVPTEDAEIDDDDAFMAAIYDGETLDDFDRRLGIALWSARQFRQPMDWIVQAMVCSLLAFASCGFARAAWRWIQAPPPVTQAEQDAAAEKLVSWGSMSTGPSADYIHGVQLARIAKQRKLYRRLRHEDFDVKFASEEEIQHRLQNKLPISRLIDWSEVPEWSPARSKLRSGAAFKAPRIDRWPIFMITMVGQVEAATTVPIMLTLLESTVLTLLLAVAAIVIAAMFMARTTKVYSRTATGGKYFCTRSACGVVTQVPSRLACTSRGYRRWPLFSSSLTLKTCRKRYRNRRCLSICGHFDSQIKLERSRMR
jgi:hypothetical protein